MKNLNKQMTSSKLIFLELILPLLFIATSCSNARKVPTVTIGATTKLNSDILVGPGECMLRKFEGTSVNNKFYLYWVFQSNTNQFLFEVESSTDGKKFRPCYFKNGALSPGVSTLMLCMTDSINKTDAVFYRIKAIAENSPIKKETEKEYKALFSASTILVVKNKKTKGYMQEESAYPIYEAMK